MTLEGRRGRHDARLTCVARGWLQLCRGHSGTASASVSDLCVDKGQGRWVIFGAVGHSHPSHALAATHHLCTWLVESEGSTLRGDRQVIPVVTRRYSNPRRVATKQPFPGTHDGWPHAGGFPSRAPAQPAIRRRAAADWERKLGCPHVFPAL